MSNTFVSFMPAVAVALDIAERKAISAACDVGRNQVVKNISGSRSGIRYKVPGTSVMYTASAPGEYPAVQLGDLKGSVRFVIKGGDGYIGSDSDHALPLEKKPPSKGGREWLRPSLNQAKPGMLVKINQRWF